MSKLMQYIINWFGKDCFLLKDLFTGNLAAPLTSPRICTHVGQLILDQTDGQFSIVNGEFTWPAQGTPAWGDQDWHALKNDGDQYEVLSGKKLILKFRGAFQLPAAVRSCWFGFNLNNTPTGFGTAEHTFYRAVALGGGIRCTSGGSDTVQNLRDLWPAAGSYFQTAIVLRPYTSTGLHWYPSAPGVFAHGAHFYWRDESDADSWRLAWYRQLQSRTDPLYPAFSNYSSAGKFDYTVIPCDDEDIWNPLFIPIAYDEFTDTNGVLLPNHTMNYGGYVWVSEAGVWIITGNEADPDASTPAIVDVHTLTPDIWGEVAVDAITEWIGLTLRKSADTSGGANHWMCYIKGAVAGVDTYMTEFNDGAQTHRATGDNDWADQARNIRVRADGLQMTLYVDYVEALHYATAWFNRHATWHGLYAQGYDAGRFDNFIILPRGTGLTRIAYDSLTGANGTSLSGRALDEGGLTYIQYSGVWTIQTNEADVGVTANARLLVESGISNGWVGSRATINTDNRSNGLALRQAGGADYWQFYIMTGVAGTDTYLNRLVGGVLTTIASADNDWGAAPQTYYLEAELDDATINCYVNGTQVLTTAVATDHQTETVHGIYSSNDGASRFDQLRVTEQPALGEYDATLNSIQ